MSLPVRELLIDAVKGGALTLALFLAYVTFPVVGLAAGMIAPLPAIYYYLRRGALTGILAVAITFTVLFVMGERTIPLLYLLQSGVLGIMLPFFYLQGKGTARSIAYTVGINFLLIVVVALGYGFWAGVDLQEVLLKGINSSTDQAVAIYGKQGLSKEDLDMFSQGIRQAGALIAKIFPAIMLVVLVTIASLNMHIIFRLKAKRLPDIPEPDQLITFKNPDLLVWVVILAGFSMLVPDADISRVAQNLLVVTGFAYFFQGLAVILVFFNRIAIPRLARGIFWLMLMFQPYLVLALAVFGLFDTWGNFRTPKIKNL
ncbi:MAG: YybS family protein [Geobacteraceae bacterium]|nr:YybS family protein [Geobacteraceae bacterium]